MLSRTTLCLASEAPGFTLHDGDDQFLPSVIKHYSTAENEAAEKLMKLKRHVASVPTERFWSVLLPGVADIVHAEYTFIGKRILPDDPSSVVEMPAIGEPGSCFNAVAMYINDGKSEEMVMDYTYATYGGACAQMRYDKVFLAPSALDKYIPTRLSDVKIKPESYIGIPLFHKDKCFGHIACLWSDVSTFSKSGLTWGFTEMILHALEDIVIAKLLQGTTLQPVSPALGSRKLIPQAAVAAAQSLKPYARSLSHELRTPIQSMVGGMDLIGATLDDILTSGSLEDALLQAQKARELIADFQDSSRRAVRAADNVVQAYDLDMQVPDIPALLEDETEDSGPLRSPPLTDTSSSTGTNSSGKRKRSEHDESQRPAKSRTPHHSRHTSAVAAPVPQHPYASIEKGPETPRGSDENVHHEGSPTTPSTGVVQIRNFVKKEVSELLNNGDMTPVSVQFKSHSLGEHVDITSVSLDGTTIQKSLSWDVQPSVPLEIMIEEKELSKTFTAVVANALKFTSDGGVIKVDVKLSPKSRYIIITVTDNGCGIPATFQPRMFQPFAREDETITRHNEGLGLGLLVAKGNARKMGGDVYLLKSATDGLYKGSQFELKIPVSPFDAYSRHATPSRSGSPARTDIPPTPFDLESTSTSIPRSQAAPLKLNLDEQQGLAITPAQLLTPGSPSEKPRPMVVTTSAKAPPIRPSFNRELSKKHPHRILVAEDSSLNRKLMVNMLSKLGYTQIVEAFDGREAVRIMEDASKNNSEISIILMDLWMPNMDGYEAAQRILGMRKLQPSCIHRDLKILAVTADTTDTALERVKEVGMVGCMTKPFKILDLEKLIVEHSRPLDVTA